MNNNTILSSTLSSAKTPGERRQFDFHKEFVKVNAYRGKLTQASLRI